MKKAQKTQTRKRKRADQICNLDKRYANHYYNIALNKETYDHLMKFVVHPFIVCKTDLLHRIQTQVGPVFDETVVVDSSNAMAVVCHFIQCAEICQQWLTTELSAIGWKTNMTSYHPLSVSHSTKELTRASLECFKMACKQMILVLEYKDP